MAITQPSGNQQFLSLEDQAGRLVDELTALRVETASYATADKSLRDVSASLQTLMTELANAASRIGEAASIMREIGTPQILDRQQTALSQLSSLESSIGSARASLSELHEQVQQAIVALDNAANLQQQGTDSVLSRIDDHVSRVADLREMITDQFGRLTTELERTHTISAEIASRLDEQRTWHAANAHATRLLMIKLAAALGALLIVVAALVVII
jgi:DNA repair ATPase RecN